MFSQKIHNKVINFLMKEKLQNDIIRSNINLFDRANAYI